MPRLARFSGHSRKGGGKGKKSGMGGSSSASKANIAEEEVEEEEIEDDALLADKKEAKEKGLKPKRRQATTLDQQHMKLTPLLMMMALPTVRSPSPMTRSPPHAAKEAVVGCPWPEILALRLQKPLDYQESSCDDPRRPEPSAVRTTLRCDDDRRVVEKFCHEICDKMVAKQQALLGPHSHGQPARRPIGGLSAK